MGVLTIFLILIIFCLIPLFVILFQGKAIINVNPRAQFWGVCSLDVTGLSKCLFDFGSACLIILIQQWHIGNGNGTITRSLSGAMSRETSYYESRRTIMRRCPPKLAIWFVPFNLHKKNEIILSSCTAKYSGLTGPIRYVNFFYL